MKPWLGLVAGVAIAVQSAPVPIYGFNIAGLVAPNGSDRGSSANVPRYAERPYTDTDAKAANDIFRTIADQTGGRAIVNDNEPARVVRAVFDEMSAYYMVADRATYPVADGKAHKLQIRVDRPESRYCPPSGCCPG